MEIFAGTSADFDDGGRVVVDVEGRQVVVLRHGDQYFALDNTCLHMGGPVGEGMIIPRVEAVVTTDRRVTGQRFSDDTVHIVCPWHGYEYDVVTGRMAGDPNRRLRTFETSQRGEEVYVVV